MKRSWAALGHRSVCFLILGTAGGAPQLLSAAEAAAVADATTDANSLETVQVSADKLHVLPTEANESVFGFGKNIIETPRSLTSISNEMLDRVNITSINDLVALTPGSFTQSFFGVAGSLDIRGTAGENYFRGVRRIENPGNYPQAIAASDRIDVVRGPASPIFGPSKVGGYLNFEPKSARAESGAYMKEAKGEISFTTGSWDEKTLHAEVGGPTTTFGKPSGFYVYGQFENSGSYYQNSATRQSIFQASYNIDFTDHFRTAARNFFDHGNIGNSNAFLPLTIEGALIRGNELAIRSPRMWDVGQFHLVYSNQTADGFGAINGGLTDFSPPEGGFALDHDQRNTANAGFDLNLPRGAFASLNLSYGSGFADGEAPPSHLAGHAELDLSAGKSFGESFSASLTILNLTNRHLLVDNSLTFGGVHYNNPRQIYAQIHYKFGY